MCCAGWESHLCTTPARESFLLVLLGGHFGTCWNAPGFEANSAYATKQSAVSPSKKRCYQHKTNILSSKCVDKCFGPWWKPIWYDRNTQPLSRFQQTPLIDRSKVPSLFSFDFAICTAVVLTWSIGELTHVSFLALCEPYPARSIQDCQNYIFKSTEIRTNDWKKQHLDSMQKNK